MVRINSSQLIHNDIFNRINDTRDLRYIKKVSKNSENPSLFVALENELHKFINDVQINIDHLIKESFDDRAEVLVLITDYQKKINEWLSSHASTDKFNLLTDIDGLKEFIVDLNIEILELYVDSKWLLSDEELQNLNVDKVSDIYEGINGFSISSLQSSPLQSIQLQGQLQAISRSYTLWTQLQVIMNDILKIIIQGIR